MPSQPTEISNYSVGLLHQVRRGKVAPPTARDFDPGLWRQAQSAAACPDDAAFIAAGLWFGDAVQTRWRLMPELGLEKMSAGVMSRHLAGVANLAQLRVDALTAQVRLGMEDDEIPDGSIAHVKLGAAGEKAATADMIRTSTLDTLGKFAGYIRTTVADAKGGAALDPAAVAAALALCEDIYLLEYLWGQVLWRDWRMTQEGQHLRFSPPAPDPWGRSFVVAEYRREQLFFEFYGVHALEWARAGSVLSPAWQVDVKRKDDRFRFSASPLWPGDGPLPTGYVLGQVLEDTELGPYLHDPLPNLTAPGITLHNLVQAWQILALAAEAIAARLNKKKPADPLAFAPVVRRSDLEGLLEVLGLTSAQRRALVDFLVWNRRAVDGLWSKPFLPVAEGRVTPVLTPLICPNLLRTAELWLTEAAGEAFFQKRGNQAEGRLQARVAAGLAQRRWGRSGKVVQEGWEPKIDGVRRDIDLVIRIGETVFVGEMKLKKYPVSAAEVGRHVQEFGHAAEQLDIRLSWLSRNLPLVAEKTGFEGDPRDLVLRGFVVSGTAFGSGVTAGAYPVIDVDELLFFFDNDAFLVAADVSARTGYAGTPLRPSLGLALVEDEPAAALLAFIEGPLHVRHAEAALASDVRINRLKASGQTLEWPEPFVDGGRLGRDLDALAEAMRADWRARVADARRRLTPQP
jgi:hypothetical protein